MFLLDWQPWDAGASLFIFTVGTAWKAALVPRWVIIPAGNPSQPKAKIFPTGFEISLGNQPQFHTVVGWAVLIKA